MHVMPPRRLILTADNRSPFDAASPDGYWKYCVPLMKHYAGLHGIHFKFAHLTAQPDGRHYPWARVLLLMELVDQYDEIMWFDSDAGVMRLDVNVFDAIRAAPPAPQWLGHAHATHDSVVVYALVDKPSHRDGVCTGIFLLDCRNKAAAKEFLQDWWNDMPDASYAHKFPWDQAVWNMAWKSDPRKAARIRAADMWATQDTEPNQVFFHTISPYKHVRTLEARQHATRTMNPRSKQIAILAPQTDYYANYHAQELVNLKPAFEALGYKTDLYVKPVVGGLPYVATDIPYMFLPRSELKPADCALIVYSSLYIPTAEERAAHRAAGAKTVFLSPYATLTEQEYLHFKQFADDVWVYGGAHGTRIPRTWVPLFALPIAAAKPAPVADARHCVMIGTSPRESLAHLPATTGAQVHIYTATPTDPEYATCVPGARIVPLEPLCTILQTFAGKNVTYCLPDSAHPYVALTLSYAKSQAYNAVDPYNPEHMAAFDAILHK
jgi:hypothetical protein